MRPGMVCVFVVAIVIVAAAAFAEPAKPNCNGKRPGGEIEEAIVGFEQAGASAATHTQSFFFDFFISRPLPIVHDPCDGTDEASRLYGPRARWWGNVRVGSYPQQVNASVASFVTNFASEAKNLKVNELAQTAEFVSGLEWRVREFAHGLDGNDRDERQLFALSVFAGGGASGPLEPHETLQIFETPARGTPQYDRFAQQFPEAATTPFIGFVSPDRDRFFREYSAGLRLTTFYQKKGTLGRPDELYMAAPAMISASIGQNEVVTGGRLEGVVARFEAFYPLLLHGDRSDRVPIVYLFGTAMLRLGGARNLTPFILKPRPDVNGYDPGVTITTSPNNRDTYMIGAGIDLTQLLKAPGASLTGR